MAAFGDGGGAFLALSRLNQNFGDGRSGIDSLATDVEEVGAANFKRSSKQ